jgi:manganese transport protein
VIQWFKNIGPGPLVAAAFIGPGTVTVCTLAGVNFGFSLLWAMILSIIATIVLQEMSARLGIISQKGLAEVIRTEIQNPIIKVLTITLIFSAIVFGNAAYEAGNITGAVLGLETLIGIPKIIMGSFKINLLSICIGLITFLILFFGNYKTLEKVLVSLVILMSFAFLITTFITKPIISKIIEGAFVPKLSQENLLTVIGLIGTTVVPYNLFLHASLVREKWHNKSDLQFARKDTFIAVVLGGIVSMCIIITAASIQTNNISSVVDLAKGLEPLFGGFSKYFLAIGLFAAGITSAITAPLAAAYVTSGCLGWKSDLHSKKFRSVWIIILILGVILSSLEIKPIDIIKFAQIANGVLLPVIASFLIWIMNQKSILGEFKNSKKQNIFAFFVLGISILLSLATLNKVFNFNLI